MSGASNINAVKLASAVPGGVTIEGVVSPDRGDKVTLLHVWLTQPGCGNQAGAGLAIDYLAVKDSFTGGDFTIAAPLPGPGGSGMVGEFFAGPATASVIAVLSDDSGAVVKEVLQWSRIVVLTNGTVEAATPAEEA